jgi:hypothetical protein
MAKSAVTFKRLARNSEMSERRKMGVSDWISAAFNLLIGALLGSVIYGLVQLVASGLWLMAVILVLLGGGLFLFMFLYDKLFDWLFLSWTKPARNPQPRLPKPLLRILSLPAGFILGIVLAVLGLDRTILDFLP